VGRVRGALGWVALFSLFVNLLMLAAPLYMLQVYDRVLASGRVETLAMLTLMVGGAAAALAALESQRTAMTVRIGAWLQQVMGPELLDAGTRARLSGEGGGAQAFRDLGQVQGFVGTQGMTAFFDFPWTPLFVAVIWILHPWLGMLAAATAVLLLALSLLNEAVTRGLLREANAAGLGAQRLAEAAIDNAEPARAMGMGGALAERWRAANAEAQGALLKASERGGRVTGAAKFLRVFAQSAILGLGALLVLRGEATPGVMIAASILLSRALAPVDLAMSAWRNFAQARIAYGRLKALSEAHPPEPARVALPAPEGGLVVEGLTAHGPSGAVLRRVSFEAGPGQVVAVIGPSASGKSTLCRHLVGLARPSAGTVTLGGARIDGWDPQALGRHVGFLPQEVGLFAGSIRDNVARMDAGATDEAVVEAARLAHAHEMIAQLPRGYATELGDRGSGLSGGQRQRIGLARAVHGAPALVVLDEPNANLDQAGEAALAATLAELKRRGATVIVVGHRPSTLAQADLVLLMRRGAVNAFGPRAEVLSKLRAAKSEEEDEPRRPPVLRLEPSMAVDRT
jgi:ATP-binding cassette subfamily C protein/ATP-binding cassette subfamily C exporter for protease/lipase/ATP-binding cassette subfamily C protein EexD